MRPSRSARSSVFHVPPDSFREAAETEAPYEDDADENHEDDQEVVDGRRGRDEVCHFLEILRQVGFLWNMRSCRQNDGDSRLLIVNK